ncbi:FIST N-terminal domain-containing protein [Methylobacterium sp. A54F]
MAHSTQTRAHRCGAVTIWTDAEAAEDAAGAVALALAGRDIGQLLVFFSRDYGPEAVNAALTARLPGTEIAGCTTSGGITPGGGIDRGLVALAFPRAGFRIVSTLLGGIGEHDVERTASAVRALRRGLDAACPDGEDECRFALSLIDGLTNAEETVVSAIAWALDGIPLVGGSAGDDLNFRDTVLIWGGAVHRNAAVLLLVQTSFPIQIFKSDNFAPTPKKFVVTRSDEGERRVHELNAEPAAREYAMSVGLDPESLSPMSFAAYPLAVKIGGEYFCRSIRYLNEDGSLSFFCAIDEGVVLTLAEPRGIVETTQAELDRLDDELGGIDLVIGFDCVLRRLDAEMRQVRQGICDLYRRFNVVGFETYGEQYRSLHLNQTFTGVAIGRAGGR